MDEDRLDPRNPRPNGMCERCLSRSKDTGVLVFTRFKMGLDDPNPLTLISRSFETEWDVCSSCIAIHADLALDPTVTSGIVDPSVAVHLLRMFRNKAEIIETNCPFCVERMLDEINNEDTYDKAEH